MNEIIISDLGIKVTVSNNDRGICKEPTCRKQIYWITNPKTLRRTPVSEVSDGSFISHFKDCTKPNSF